MTLRALRARSGQSLALFATGVLAVAGCVAAVGYSRVTGVSIGSAGALLLLGVAALAAQGAASVRARRYEIALAQLRGRHGLGLLRTAVAEPAVILLAAAAAGTALGWLVARAAVHRWVGGDATFEMTSIEWATSIAVLAVSVVVLVAVSWRTAYQPLTGKLDSHERPRPPTATGLFLSLLVLMGAAVSVYQARQRGASDADWVSFLSPALVGLAAGQIGLWLVALLSRIGLGSPRLNSRLDWFITLRRLARRADSGTVIRLVVAAVVVAGVAGSAWLGAGAWRDQTARMQTGGPIAFTVPTGGLQAYMASHEADPQGRWLMALSAAPDPSGGSYRDVFVDAPRWDSVVGSFFADTPLAEVSTEVDALSPAQAVQPTSGGAFSVTLTARSAQRALPTERTLRRVAAKPWSGGFSPLQFTAEYVDSEGNAQILQVPGKLLARPEPVRPGLVGYSRAIPGCPRGCALESVYVQGSTRKVPLHLTAMSFGDLELLPVGDSGLVPMSNRAVHTVPSKDGLDLRLTDPYTPHPLLSWQRDKAPAALVTPALTLERSAGQPQAYGLDGEPRPVQIVGQVPALPLIGRAGLLLDLGTALRGAGGQIPETQTLVVARADTPAAVLQKLRATGAAERQHTVEQALADIQRSGTAQGTRLFTLIAVFGLLLAAVSVVSSTAEQRRARRREAASLRVVGVDAGEVTRGYRGEAGLLGAAVAVVAAASVWIGCRALLDVLPLVQPGQFGLPFDATPRVDLVGGLAAVAGIFVALVVFWGLRVVGRSSPPSLLRDESQ